MTEETPSYENNRTRNNVMRHGYRTLSDQEKQEMLAVKEAGLALWNAIDAVCLKCGGGSRELSLAKTKAQESVMWAIKHITG